MAVLTVKELEAIRPDQDGETFTMGDGMQGLVIARAQGVSIKVSWRYKIDGKQRRIVLGTWRKGESLKAFRDMRDSMQAELRRGIDPIEKGRADRLNEAAALAESKRAASNRLEAERLLNARQTVQELFSAWEAAALKTRADKGAEVRRSFTADVFPLIGDIAAQDIQRVHVNRIILEIGKRATPERDMVRTKRKTLADIRQMFDWAVDQELIATNPTANIKKHKLGKDGERDRVLSEGEVVELFKKLPLSGLHEISRTALMIQISTMCRIGELLAAEWAHVDMDRGQWTIPETKNGKKFTVDISPFALIQFETLKRLTGKTPWLIPNSSLTGPIDPKAITKQTADRQRGNAEPLAGRTQQTDSLSLSGGQWRPHDLRRTGATMCAELGALPDVIERCLNHTVSERMKRIYQRAQYGGHMREAWHTLGARLEILQLQAMGLAENVATLNKKVA